MSEPHYIAADLGYPVDRVPAVGEIPSRATWDAYVEDELEAGALERLHAEDLMDGLA